MTATLIEYHWKVETSKYEVANTFVFSPEPSSFHKEAKVEWIIRHSGTVELKKRRWRYRRTETFKLTGLLDTEADRQKLEALSTRNSVFKIDLGDRLKSIVSISKVEGSTYPPQVQANAFFIITSFTCEQAPAKPPFSYNITLERVTDLGVVV